MGGLRVAREDWESRNSKMGWWMSKGTLGHTALCVRPMVTHNSIGGGFEHMGSIIQKECTRTVGASGDILVISRPPGHMTKEWGRCIGSICECSSEGEGWRALYHVSVLFCCIKQL